LRWGPEADGRYYLAYYKLVEEPTRLSLLATKWTYAGYGASLLLGLSCLWGFSQAFGRDPDKDALWVVGLAVGLVIGGIGVHGLLFGRGPIVFDRGNNHFWKGRRLERCPENLRARLTDIVGIQLLFKRVLTKRGSEFRFQTNLVLNNNRIPVVYDDNLQSARKLAHTIARFLDVPVWEQPEIERFYPPPAH
ncbi:MAG: hypothetical protein ACE5FN_11455, partial [Leptospirillia bacterium]